MLIRVGMEEDPGKRYTAWALDFPGCFANGNDQAEALLALPRKLLEFDYWVRLHTDQPWFHLDGLDMHIDETYKVARVNLQGEEYEINAFFRDDLRPLTDRDVDQALQVLHWQQEELLAGLEFVNEDRLNQIEVGQRWSILGIVRHLAFAELWYLKNFGLPTTTIPQDTEPISVLMQSHKAVVNTLASLVDNPSITEYAQERWSARKLLRRILWHRRVHIDHIRQLLGLI
ncbi:MAG: DinB family protein [Chloroflexi bacterium]|jgi:hypothetical protein|nr:DinB family protein [Chloroflexota bacterium]